MKHTLLTLSLALLPLSAAADSRPEHNLPDNRITQVLTRPGEMLFPPGRADGADDALWAEDALIPADKLGNLWRAAVDNLPLFLSWFCDAAGEYFVIVSTDAACYHRYHMFVYHWESAHRAFRRKGEFTLASRTWAFCGRNTTFSTEGMQVVCERGAKSGQRERCSHFFLWKDKVAEQWLKD